MEQQSPSPPKRTGVMAPLGYHLLRTRVHAALTITVLTALALHVPPFSYFISGAPMGLVALRKGALVGVQVAVGSMVLLALLAKVLNIHPAIPLGLMFSVWLPVILCAALLRATRSQGLMALAAGTMGIFFAGLMYILMEDIQNWWQEWLERVKEYAASEQAVGQLEQAHELISPMLSMFFASGFVMSLIITMLLARWWQSLLFNPGGFRQEFYALRLPRILVAPTLLGLLALLLAPDAISIAVRDAVFLMLVLYLFQGLSVIHGFLHVKARSRVWLIGIYLLLILLPRPMLLFICGAGLVNACLGREPLQSADGKP